MRRHAAAPRAEGPGGLSFKSVPIPRSGERPFFPAGFSLLEVTIATAVMIGALLAFMGVEVTMMRAGGHAGRRWEAVRMARNRVERLRGVGYEAVVGCEGQDVSGEGICCSWEVSPEGSIPDLARIDVVCDWHGTLTGRSITVTTLLAK